ncbi:MAG: hypothetical protein KGO82_14725 [Bacteroidota bacterium]|nr:hypothetical protein [Bacteroidota bacterium]
MIEVFRTDIAESAAALKMISILQQAFPGSRVNIDLHDCDKVLRLEGAGFEVPDIIQMVEEQGFICSVLE